MTGDVHPDPSGDLVHAARSVTPGWLRRIIADAADRGGVDLSERASAIDELVAVEAAALLDGLERLLATDVDAQRTNPLSLFRAAVAAPNRLLREAGVPQPDLDAFAVDVFPDDPYGLGPATWGDIDERLIEPGLAWGAWKAMTVLRRRRDEGLR
ncbi:MAG: hypothetical protein QNJ12_07810 [Ilumatobacter sp.]|uniref:hypothetical protein n=1 Tax=Ilumatobacter sp. TaxID=1967498 RepID=UPI00260B84D2|nr:hypothetical protein [Ilumatobacter sp.]MDJ0768683.1 hypothetical protein [Ilumatobacter sp.]